MFNRHKIKSAKQNSQEGKVLQRQADRAQRMSGENSRISRKRNAEESLQKAQSFGDIEKTAIETTINSINDNIWKNYDN